MITSCIKNDLFKTCCWNCFMSISPNVLIVNKGLLRVGGSIYQFMDAPPGFQNGLISGHCPAGLWNSQPGNQRTKSFVMNVSQTINPDQKVPWYSISLPCLLLKPEEYQTTRFIFVQVNKQLALSRHAASIATRYVCSMPPVCPCRRFQRNAVTDQFSVSLTQ